MRQFLSKLNSSASDRQDQAGAASLPTILALSILILAIGIGITALSLSESFVSLGQKQSSQALSYAEAGARDALVRVARDKRYSCTTADCYAIDLVTGGCSGNDGCARITVSSGAGTSGDPKIITSKGQAKANIRRVQVSVVFDANQDGEIATATWSELTN